jgi:hypothetical protein
MNERIRELAVQADPTLVKVLGESAAREFIMKNGIRPENMQDFVQLIVAEFSKQVQIEGRFRLEREQTLIRLCCENAKKHFGVKE